MAIEKTVHYNCEPSQLWEIVGTPDRTDWVPGVTDCVFDGEVRSLTLPGAGSIKEKIISRDDPNMTMQYSCIESPMPLESHLAEVQVSASGNQTKFVWKTTVEPEQFEKFIAQSMDGAIEQLRSMLES